MGGQAAARPPPGFLRRLFLPLFMGGWMRRARQRSLGLEDAEELSAAAAASPTGTLDPQLPADLAAWLQVRS